MEKYYQPDRTEFCIGFEYEYKEQQKGWVKRTMKSFNDRPDGTMNMDYCLQFKAKRFRVKKLDREDIESCGFKKDLGERYRKTVEGIHFDLLEIAPYYTMRQDERENLVRIFFIQQINDFEQLARSEMFRGDIKNKSELKKILSWVGI